MLEDTPLSMTTPRSRARVAGGAAAAALALLLGTAGMVAAPGARVRPLADTATARYPSTQPAHGSYAGSLPRALSPASDAGVQALTPATLSSERVLPEAPSLAAPSLEALEAKLEKQQFKLAAAQALVAEWQATLAQRQLDLATAQAAYAAALADYEAAIALPAGTPEEAAARAAALAKAKAALAAAKKALKHALKAVAAADKKLAHWLAKEAKHESKIVALQLLIEELGGDDPDDPLEPPAAPSLAAEDAVGAVSFSWEPVAEATSYTLYLSGAAGVDLGTAEVVADASSPHVVDGLAPGTTLHAVVTASAGELESAPSNEVSATSLRDAPPPSGSSPYDPPWAGVAALQVITLDHDGQLSDTENGARLRNAVLALQAGDRLEVGGGTWSISPKFSPSMHGTAVAPIWVVAQEGETPVITRPDAAQNLMNPAASYVCFRGLEFTGGSAGIKFDTSDNVWIDACEIHHVGEAGIAANSADTSFLYITRNHIHHTGGYGEGMYLGANNGAVVMSQSVVALNHVHDTTGVLQGDGIELKQGSWGNWIAENLIHDTKYPCLTVYGTGGLPVNLIERNVLVGSQDNVLQVQGEAIVRSNLIVNGNTGFHSHDHQGSTRDLVVVHNTILNSGKAARLLDWNGRPGMVFANNAVYSAGSTAVEFGSGSSGVQIAGNVVYGAVVGASPAGFSSGTGLSDFVAAAWTGTAQDPTPAEGSPLIGAGDPTWAVDADLQGDGFEPAPAAGCAEAQP